MTQADEFGRGYLRSHGMVDGEGLEVSHHTYALGILKSAGKLSVFR